MSRSTGRSHARNEPTKHPQLLLIVTRRIVTSRGLANIWAESEKGPLFTHFLFGSLHTKSPCFSLRRGYWVCESRLSHFPHILFSLQVQWNLDNRGVVALSAVESISLVANVDERNFPGHENHWLLGSIGFWGLAMADRAATPGEIWQFQQRWPFATGKNLANLTLLLRLEFLLWRAEK